MATDPRTLIFLCAEAARILTPSDWRVAIVEARRLRNLDTRLGAGDEDVEPYEEWVDQKVRDHFGDDVLRAVDDTADALANELHDWRWAEPLSGGEEALAAGAWYTAVVEALIGRSGPYLQIKTLEPIRVVAIRAAAGGEPAVRAEAPVVWPGQAVAP